MVDKRGFVESRDYALGVVYFILAVCFCLLVVWLHARSWFSVG